MAKLAGEMAGLVNYKIPGQREDHVCRTSCELAWRQGWHKTGVAIRESRYHAWVFTVADAVCLRCGMYLFVQPKFDRKSWFFVFPFTLPISNKLFGSVIACLVQFFVWDKRAWSIFDWWAYSKRATLWHYECLCTDMHIPLLVGRG